MIEGKKQKNESYRERRWKLEMGLTKVKNTLSAQWASASKFGYWQVNPAGKSAACVLLASPIETYL